jgi:hypothetical protein
MGTAREPSLYYHSDSKYNCPILSQVINMGVVSMILLQTFLHLFIGDNYSHENMQSILAQTHFLISKPASEPNIISKNQSNKQVN